MPTIPPPPQPTPPTLTTDELRTVIEALTTLTGTLQTALNRLEGKTGNRFFDFPAPADG